MCNSQHFLRIHTVPHGITPVFLFLYMCQSRSLCRRLEECSMIEIRLNALGHSLNFSVILWKSWRTRVNSSEPFQWPFMTCKYCHFPTCFCSETDAVRGLGRKTVAGSESMDSIMDSIMDTMWFHSNNVKIIGKRWELQKVTSVRCFSPYFTCSSNVSYYCFQGFRGHGWSQAGQLLYDCICWGFLPLSWNSQGKLRIL